MELLFPIKDHKMIMIVYVLLGVQSKVVRVARESGCEPCFGIDGFEDPSTIFKKDVVEEADDRNLWWCIAYSSL